MKTTQRTGDYYGDGTQNHIWETRDEDGTLVAELYVSTERNEIMNIQVNNSYRREGHARHLYETACAAMDIYHAPEAHRTPEGNAFAKAVGGYTTEPYPCGCYACDQPDDEEDEDNDY